MTDMQDDNRFAPPKALIEEPLPQDGLPILAERGARLGAALVDGLVAMVIACVVLLPLYGTAFFVLIQQGLGTVWKGFAINFVVNMAVQGWFLYQTSQSIGKKLVGLRIVRPDGSHADIGRILGLRMVVPALINLVPFVGKIFSFADCLFIFSKSRRCLHDLIADTIVVTAESSTHAVLPR